jgi:hypothetical protein
MYHKPKLSKITGPMRDEVMARWIKVHDEQLHNSIEYYLDQIKENEMGRVCR